jgi:phosphate transport system substrate-binding protein
MTWFFACVQNPAGQFVCPSAEAFSSAVESTDWGSARDFNLIATNAPGARACPIMATTFIVMPRQSKEKGSSDAALNFLLFGLEKGQDEAKALNYVPLPAQLVSQVKAYISAKIN